MRSHITRWRLVSISVPLLVLGCGPDGEAQLSSKTEPSHDSPPVTLAQPEWRSLSGTEIRQRFSNRQLGIDSWYEIASGIKPVVSFGGACRPSETFYADGRWTMAICEIDIRYYRGQWTTEQFRGGERLCVKAPNFQKACRFVWQGRSPDQVFMPASLFSESVEWNETYNPYRLTPLNRPNIRD